MKYLSRLINIAPHQGESLTQDCKYEEHLTRISENIFTSQPPFAHVLYIIKGSITISINHQEKIVKASHLIILLPHQSIALKSYSKNLTYKKLSLSLSMYKEITNRIPHEIMVEIGRHPILHFEPKDNALIRQYARIVKEKCSNPHHFSKDSMIQVLFASIIDIYYLLLRNKPDIRLIKPNYQRRFEHFRDLVTVHYRQRWSVSKYSEQLIITPEQLNDCVKRSSGMNTKQWLNNYLIRQIRTRLVNNVDTLETISIEFNFPSTNALNQFYRSQTKESPTTYKKRLQNSQK